jgi:hypothetical protein
VKGDIRKAEDGQKSESHVDRLLVIPLQYGTIVSFYRPLNMSPIASDYVQCCLNRIMIETIAHQNGIQYSVFLNLFISIQGPIQLV